MNNSKELEFIIDILFSEKKINKSIFRNLSYKNITRISSEHLIVPTLYYNLKRKKLIEKIPNDFNYYLNEIFTINRERNQKLLSELNFLSTFFNTEGLKHVFIKGSATIISGIYHDLGERMIGDIDFIIKENQIDFFKKIIDKIEYRTTTPYSFLNPRHLTKRINKNKLFSIEAHTRVLETKSHLFDPSRIFKGSIEKNNFIVPSTIDLMLNNVYSSQINDNGYNKLSIDLRSLYDSKMILKKMNNNFKINNKFLFTYFTTARKYNIIFNDDLDFDFKKHFFDDLRLRYYTLNKIYLSFNKICYMLNLRLLQLIEVFKNKNYLRYLIFKKKY